MRTKQVGNKMELVSDSSPLRSWNYEWYDVVEGLMGGSSLSLRKNAKIRASFSLAPISMCLYTRSNNRFLIDDPLNKNPA